MSVSDLRLPRDPTPLPDPGDSGGQRILRAAVAVVARPAPAGHELLLIKRAAAHGDPWSGHMAFPGGKIETGDRHLLDTARRETREETGLSLPDRPPRWIGRLPGVSPRGAKLLPPLEVTPFVFHVETPAEAHVASPEVDSVHWIPLDHLVDPDRRGEYHLRIGDGGASRRFPAIDVVGEQVWGLTYRILEELFARLP